MSIDLNLPVEYVNILYQQEDIDFNPRGNNGITWLIRVDEEQYDKINNFLSKYYKQDNILEKHNGGV